MEKPTIKKSIEISAPVKKVWDVFTNPSVSRQMGGEYVSEWKVGSSFSWKGSNGTVYTNGKILEIEKEKFIKHELFDLKDENRLLSTITYEFIDLGQKTILNTKENIEHKMTKTQTQDTSNGWDFALQAVKELAERI
jgi:uncharacterized protein YndB with AHSA1/START domain